MGPRQFKLSSIFCVTSLICCILALSVYPDSIVARLAQVVLAANVLGVIAALAVTFGLGFPRDGSYRVAPKETEQDEFPA